MSLAVPTGHFPQKVAWRTSREVRLLSNNHGAGTDTFEYSNRYVAAFVKAAWRTSREVRLLLRYRCRIQCLEQ